MRLDRRGSVPRGALILVYAVGYGIGRFLVELLRIDTVERYAGLSRNNWLALLLVIIGIAGLLRLRSAGEPEQDADRSEERSADGESPADGSSDPSPSTLPDDEPEA